MIAIDINTNSNNIKIANNKTNSNIKTIKIINKVMNSNKLINGKTIV